jgi:hypothetical protein
MKHVSKCLLAVSAVALLGLAACGEGSAPSKKDVQVKPVDPKNATAPAGASFKGGDNMGSTTNVPGDKPK